MIFFLGLFEALPDVVDRLRKISPLYANKN